MKSFSEFKTAVLADALTGVGETNRFRRLELETVAVQWFPNGRHEAGAGESKSDPTMEDTSMHPSLPTLFAGSKSVDRTFPFASAVVLTLVCFHGVISAQLTDYIGVSDDGGHFVRGSKDERFIVWGVNYDHDGAGRLLDEYWIDEWATVVEDFREIRTLGANCVRIHLQFGLFMDAPNEPNVEAFQQLKRIVKLAEDTGLYLNITGLACYHKKNVPDWYDKLSEQDRWAAQAVFWEEVAKSCRNSPAIFCYDLMNEPILPGKQPATEWLAGEFGGKHYVQRLTLDLKGRPREQVAEIWVDTMVDAIRKHDQRHLVTVGVIPWVFVFGGGEPLFHSQRVGKRLDFVAVHFYPEKGKVDKALAALQAYEGNKPLLIEELFPLKCGHDELGEFVRKSSADGWISFYWGTTVEELRAKENPTIADTITASWLETFREMSDRVTSGNGFDRR